MTADLMTSEMLYPWASSESYSYRSWAAIFWGKKSTFIWQVMTAVDNDELKGIIYPTASRGLWLCMTNNIVLGKKKYCACFVSMQHNCHNKCCRRAKRATKQTLTLSRLSNEQF